MPRDGSAVRGTKYCRQCKSAGAITLIDEIAAFGSKHNVHEIVTVEVADAHVIAQRGSWQRSDEGEVTGTVVAVDRIRNTGIRQDHVERAIVIKVG